MMLGGEEDARLERLGEGACKTMKTGLFKVGLACLPSFLQATSMIRVPF
jgi:hypothetical protein